MTKLIILVLCLLVLLVIIISSAKSLKRKLRTKRFYKKESILTPGEFEFHRIIKEAIPEAAIFTKVNMGDVISASEFRFRGHFSQKHFDWLICDPTSLEPLVAIELDDSSHRRKKSQERDAVKDEIAREAELPLVRFKWSSHYDEAMVREIIAKEINTIADKQEAKSKNNAGRHA